MFVCGKEQRELRLLDVATLTWSAVPSTDQVKSMFESPVTVEGIGRVWIATTLETADRLLHPLWIEHATGRVVGDEPSDLTKYPNLDAPELWAPLCPPLRRTPNRAWAPDEPSGLRWTPPDLKGTHALDTLHGRLMLRSCGTTKTRRVTRSFGWSGASFSGDVFVDEERRVDYVRRYAIDL